MGRYRFAPDPQIFPGPKYPTVLLIPPAVWRNADASGVPSERAAAVSLQKRGFLVFMIESRLANPGHIHNQPAHTYPFDISGTPPQQQGDIERQILAVLDPSEPQCNGTIYVVGGSSGGCHALWVGLTSTASDGSGWSDTARAHIKAVVSLSGPTDLSNWTDYDPQVDIAQYIADGENYTSTEEYPPADADKKTILLAASPISLVPNASNIPPVLMFGTELDPVPWQQGFNMWTALHPYSANVTFHEVNRTAEHAFNYWYDTDGQDSQGRCVKDEVIDFLNAHP